MLLDKLEAKIKEIQQKPPEVRKKFQIAVVIGFMIPIILLWFVSFKLSNYLHGASQSGGSFLKNAVTNLQDQGGQIENYSRRIGEIYTNAKEKLIELTQQ